MSQIIVTASQGGGGGGALNTLTPSVGGVVSPTLGGTIKLLSGSNITTTGTPGLNKIVFDLISSPTVTGTVTAHTFDTSTVATNLSITGSTITAGGTNPNVDIDLQTQGTGNFNITTATGGEIVYRGVTAGFTDTQWRTTQATLQTVGAVATNILVVPLANNIMATIKAYVNGFKDDYTNALGGEICITAYRGAGNITIAGAPFINVNYASTTDTTDIDGNVDVGTQSIQIQVIGVAAQTFNWVATANIMFTISNL
jgi:hypothetical protein